MKKEINMTVKELIERLKELPQNALAYIEYDATWYKVTNANLEKTKYCNLEPESTDEIFVEIKH